MGLHINLGLGISSSYDFGTIFLDVHTGLVSGSEYNPREGRTDGLSNIPTTFNLSLGGFYQF